jgi:formate hydrogenlyase subunit 3/multisubunit Na+/H+ antiporter MnhD subunit
MGSNIGSAPTYQGNYDGYRQNLAAASMAGLPLFGGFIAKEQLYDTVRLAPLSGLWSAALMVAAVGASMCLGAAGLIAGVAPFQGRSMPAPVSRCGRTSTAVSSLWAQRDGTSASTFSITFSMATRSAASSVPMH